MENSAMAHRIIEWLLKNRFFVQEPLLWRKDDLWRSKRNHQITFI